MCFCSLITTHISQKKTPAINRFQYVAAKMSTAPPAREVVVNVHNLFEWEVEGRRRVEDAG